MKDLGLGSFGGLVARSFLGRHGSKPILDGDLLTLELVLLSTRNMLSRFQSRLTKFLLFNHLSLFVFGFLGSSDDDLANGMSWQRSNGGRIIGQDPFLVELSAEVLLFEPFIMLAFSFFVIVSAEPNGVGANSKSESGDDGMTKTGSVIAEVPVAACELFRHLGIQ